MAPSQVVHMLLAANVSVGFAVAGVHAVGLWRRPTATLHRRALALALLLGGSSAIVQPLSGHLSGEAVAHTQPVKLAAMEGQFTTERDAPLRIGGWPDEARRETPWAIEIPYALSILAHGDPHAEVLGLEAFPEEDWPPVAVVHLAFQVMIGIGTLLALVSVGVAGVTAWRREVPTSRPVLALLVLCAPLGVVALEAGWVVTEVGRQPWIIQGVMRTSEAVTPVQGLSATLVGYALIYLVLAVVVVRLLAALAAAVDGEGGAR
jgi:cytochrome d ubiquinol oxidase subunit I